MATCFGPRVAIIRHTIQNLKKSVKFEILYCVPDDGQLWAETCSHIIIIIIIIIIQMIDLKNLFILCNTT
jgi:hypothetical protein